MLNSRSFVSSARNRRPPADHGSDFDQGPEHTVRQLKQGPSHARWRRFVPTRDQIHANRWLRWLVPYLQHPHLWHWSRRGVSLGVALGVFFGLLVPIAQIPLSAAAAIVMRANVPAAAASTLVTNPVTFAPVYYAAYRLGAFLTGETTAREAPPPVTQLPEQNLWGRLQAVGKPLLLGLVILSSAMGLLSYALISLVWRWRILRRRQQRLSGKRPPTLRSRQQD